MDIKNVRITSKERLKDGLMNARTESIQRRLNLCEITIDAMVTAPELVGVTRLVSSNNLRVYPCEDSSIDALDAMMGGTIKNQIPHLIDGWNTQSIPMPIGIMNYRIVAMLTGTTILMLELDEDRCDEESISQAFIRTVYGLLTNSDQNVVSVASANLCGWNNFRSRGGGTECCITYITDGRHSINFAADQRDVLPELRKYMNHSGESEFPHRATLLAEIPVSEWIKLLYDQDPRVTVRYSDGFMNILRDPKNPVYGKEIMDLVEKLTYSEAVYLIPNTAKMNTVLEINLGHTAGDLVKVINHLRETSSFFKSPRFGDVVKAMKKMVRNGMEGAK